MSSVAKPKPASRGDGIRRRSIKRQRADGTSYTSELFVGEVVLGTDPSTGKRIRQAFSGSTRTEAARTKRAILHQRDRGLRVNSSAGWTVSSWCLQWVENVIKYERAEGTYWSYRGDVSNNIGTSPIGRRPLGKLEPPEVNAWKAWLHTERRLAPSTRRRCLTVLRKALQYALRQGLIARNVASKEWVDGVHVPKRAVQALSQRQLHRLLAQARSEDDPNYPMYVLAAATGMRQGELLGLRWAASETEPGLDLEHSMVRVREQLIRHRGPAKVVGHLKRDSIRDLYLDPFVVDVLRQHRVRLLEQQLLAGSDWREHNLVFPTRYGGPQRNTNAWRGFKRLLERAGLPTDFRFHDQRSTAASLAIADGASLFDVSRLLGHKDLRTTANQYGHLFPEGQREMAQRMGRLVLGEPSAQAAPGGK